MNGVAAHNAAQCDHRIVGLALVLGGVERDGDRCRNFQCARNRNDLMGDAGGVQFRNRAFQQGVLDVVIEPRLDNQRARA